MKPSEIEKIIQFDLASGKVMSALDIKRCLIVPEVVDCYDYTEAEPPEKLWLVFREDLTQKCGYSIVFDEEAHSFGLAIIGQSGKRICIGLYGSFLDAINGM